MPLGAEFLRAPWRNACQGKQQSQTKRRQWSGKHGKKRRLRTRGEIIDYPGPEASEQTARSCPCPGQWAWVDRFADTLNTALMMLKTTAPTSTAMNTMMTGGMMAVATWMR